MSDNASITHAYGWQLDKGQVRESNQDSLGAAKVKLVSEDTNRSMGVYMVADGVAGADDGNIASEQAVQTAMEEMMRHVNRQDTTEGILSALHDAAQSAHHSIRLQSDSGKKRATTLVMAVVVEKKAYIINVGDSRAYLIRDNAIRQITHDHTVAQALADGGVIDANEIEEHPFKNVLSQAVGANNFDADQFTVDIQVDDYLLLCSDGLYGYVAGHRIMDIVYEAESPQAASAALVKAANDAGGRDNIATIVVRIDERDE